MADKVWILDLSDEQNDQPFFKNMVHFLREQSAEFTIEPAQNPPYVKIRIPNTRTNKDAERSQLFALGWNAHRRANTTSRDHEELESHKINCLHCQATYTPHNTQEKRVCVSCGRDPMKKKI